MWISPDADLDASCEHSGSATRPLALHSAVLSGDDAPSPLTAALEENIVPGFVSPAWMPSSLREAPRAGDATPGDLETGAAWAHLLAKVQTVSETVLSDDVPHNAFDRAAGFRHLLVLLWIGIDDALRRESRPGVEIGPSNTDAVLKWGMDCPDCIYTGSGLRGGDTYRLWGNRGTARYVGLQTMAGMASTANVLLDEIELAPNGD